MMDAHCVVTAELAERLGLGPQVRDALQQAYERWDGRGHPEGLKGDEVAVSVRLMRPARVAEVFYRRGGAQAVVAVARERRGTCRGSSISSASGRRNCSKSSPRRQVGRPSSPPSRRCARCSPTRSSTRCLRRSPITPISSLRTRSAVRGALPIWPRRGRDYGLPRGDVNLLRRAAPVHDLGWLGVSNAIWDKPRPLTPAESERARLHPYLTQRMLASSAALRSLVPIASQHHERLDGSGYPSVVPVSRTWQRFVRRSRCVIEVQSSGVLGGRPGRRSWRSWR
jgi:hypothetical protein